jgi:uncharacterized damage-inducible protein DinB
MRSSDIVPLFRHMEWADALMWRSVLALPAEAQANVELKLWLHHIHLVQRVFLETWKGTPMTAYGSPDDFPDLASLAAWAQPAYEEAITLAASMDEAALDAPQHVAHSARAAKEWPSFTPATRAETMVQVAIHTTHHRGQIAMRVRALGGEPALMDFIAWTWKGKPAAAWPDVVFAVAAEPSA